MFWLVATHSGRIIQLRLRCLTDAFNPFPRSSSNQRSNRPRMPLHSVGRRSRPMAPWLRLLLARGLHLDNAGGLLTSGCRQSGWRPDSFRGPANTMRAESTDLIAALSATDEILHRGHIVGDTIAWGSARPDAHPPRHTACIKLTVRSLLRLSRASVRNIDGEGFVFRVLGQADRHCHAWVPACRRSLARATPRRHGNGVAPEEAPNHPLRGELCLCMRPTNICNHPFRVALTGGFTSLGR
jgi:hypothetical protein